MKNYYSRTSAEENKKTVKLTSISSLNTDNCIRNLRGSRVPPIWNTNVTIVPKYMRELKERSIIHMWIYTTNPLAGTCDITGLETKEGRNSATPYSRLHLHCRVFVQGEWVRMEIVTFSVQFKNYEQLTYPDLNLIIIAWL